MKKSTWLCLIGAILFLAFTLGTMFHAISSQNAETLYGGVLTDKGYEPPSSGYKSRRGPTYFIVMTELKTKKAIRVNVSVPTYYGTKIGDTAYFRVSNVDMYRFGNTQNVNKNLYGE